MPPPLETALATTATEKPPPDPEAVECVRAWIVSGATTFEIAQAIAKEYPDEDREALELAAADQINEAGKMHADDVRGWCTMAAQDVFKKTMAIGDFSSALAAIKLIHNMARR